MRWRLLRRCLLFALLGLVTAVAVAWGQSLPWRFRAATDGPEGVGLAAKGDTIVRVRVPRFIGGHLEHWRFIDNTREWRPLIGFRLGDAQRIREMGGAAYDEWLESNDRLRFQRLGRPQPPRREQYRIDHLAERGPSVAVPDLARGETEIFIWSYGWPFLSLRKIDRLDRIMDDGSASRDETDRYARVIESKISTRFGLQLPWGQIGKSRLFFGPDTITLPLQPRRGLIGNTVFYALLWAILLPAPGALRRRVRRARGRCPTCGYLLRGQPAPGCPECGSGRPAPSNPFPLPPTSASSLT